MTNGAPNTWNESQLLAYDMAFPLPSRLRLLHPLLFLLALIVNLSIILSLTRYLPVPETFQKEWYGAFYFVISVPSVTLTLILIGSLGPAERFVANEDGTMNAVLGFAFSWKTSAKIASFVYGIPLLLYALYCLVLLLIGRFHDFALHRSAYSYISVFVGLAAAIGHVNLVFYYMMDGSDFDSKRKLAIRLLNALRLDQEETKPKGVETDDY